MVFDDVWFLLVVGIVEWIIVDLECHDLIICLRDSLLFVHYDFL